MGDESRLVRLRQDIQEITAVVDAVSGLTEAVTRAEWKLVRFMTATAVLILVIRLAL